MPIALNSKDLEALDKEYAAESQAWELLKVGASTITEADFVGAAEVRVNIMTGFTASDYKRNEDNKREKITVTKETVKLLKQRWIGYDIDMLDQEENSAASVAKAMDEDIRLRSVPEKDKTVFERLSAAAIDAKTDNPEIKNVVEEKITEENSLKAFDAAEAYMTDAEVSGQLIMFVSAAFYSALKNNSKVSKTFTTNEVNLSGINRKVATLDNDIPIVKVAKGRLQVLADKSQINFILLPINAAMPIEKYNSIDLVPASQDRDGYRDTIKGLDYYDLIVLKNAKKAIYMSKTAAP